MPLTNALKIFIDNGNDSNPQLNILRAVTEQVKYLCIRANDWRYLPIYVNDLNMFI
jgi:hypothetical protein